MTTVSIREAYAKLTAFRENIPENHSLLDMSYMINLNKLISEFEQIIGTDRLDAYKIKESDCKTTEYHGATWTDHINGMVKTNPSTFEKKVETSFLKMKLDALLKFFHFEINDTKIGFKID